MSNNNNINSGSNTPPNYSLVLDNSVPDWNKDIISKELKDAIQDTIPIKDPQDFDRHDFDPVQYINEHFSNEQSLSKLDHVMNKLKYKINVLDEEIIQSIRLQSSVGQKGRDDLENSKRSIQELVAKIREIKNKAVQSESMVTEICKDIKTLDFAKKNLTTAITTLRRLQMMVMGLDQLKVMVDKKNYSGVAGLIQVSDDFSEAYKGYSDNPKISILTKKLEGLKIKVKGQIYEEFKNYQSLVGEGENQYPSDHWRHSCNAIQALGEETKKDFLMWFCDTQLGGYEASNYEIYPLEHTKKRFGWIAKKLGSYNREYDGVFLPEWKMEEELAFKFCSTTKFSLTNLLKIKKEHNEIEVTVLLKVLKQTLEFENHLYEKFENDSKVLNSPDQNSPDYNTPDAISLGGGGGGRDEDESDSSDDEQDSSGTVNYNAEEEIRRRWLMREERERKKEMERNNSSNSLASSSNQSTSGQQEQPQQEQQKQIKSYDRFKGIISSCFDQYMELYVEQENKLMNDSISMFLQKETWKIEDETSPNKVLLSSVDLVYLFIKIMNRCNSLSKNEPYYLLFQLFKKYLNSYAVALSNKVQIDVNRVHDSNEDKTLALVINTCEYCQKTTQQMEDSFKNTIDSKFVELIDLKEIMNEFSSIIAKSAKSLVSGLEAKIDPALQTITKLDWETDQYVGDNLPYTGEMIGHISDCFRLQSKWLSPNHYRYLCDLFAASFSLRLLLTIYKCTRISETGAQYLLLDISTIKQTLLSLSTETQNSKNNVRYVRLVNKEFAKIENLLKVVGCQKEALIDTYNQLFSERSDSEFKKIMDLKGMKTNDKTELLDKYINKVDQTLTSIKKFLPIPTGLFN